MKLKLNPTVSSEEVYRVLARTPLTFDQIAARFGISRGAVTGQIQLIKQKYEVQIIDDEYGRRYTVGAARTA